MPTPPNTGEPVPDRVRILEAKEPNNLTDEQRKWPVVEPEINPGERLTVLPPSGAVHLNADRLRTTFTALPDRERRAFGLYYVDGLSLREIAERLGVTRAVAATSVRRAREQVRAAFA